jgi:RNA polymerase sigma-70 factor (ECF subfamily)
MVDLDPGTAAVAYRGRVYRYLLGMARDPDVAEDLTQETLLRALRLSATLREPSALLSWLYRVATNVFLDKVRTDQRRPFGDRGSDRAAGSAALEGIADPGLGVDRLVEQAEMGACVRGYVNDLPDSYRAAILMHYGYGLTDREVARALRLPLATAKMRIHRGRARLQAALTAGCTFETDDRGVIVCDPVTGRPDCGPDCTWCSPGAPRTDDHPVTGSRGSQAHRPANAV